MSLKDQLTTLAENMGVDVSIVEEVNAIVEAAVATKLAEREQELAESKQAAIDKAVVDAITAHEAETEAKLTEAVQEFVAEHRERFVETEKYTQMAEFVDSIQEALAVAGVIKSDEQLQEQIDSLQEEVVVLRQQLAEANDRADTAQAAIILQKAIQEADLSCVQIDRVKTLIGLTKPETLSEFRSIVDHIIAEVKKDVKEEDNTEEEDNKQEDEDKKEKLSESMQRYVQALKSTK